MLEKNLAVLGLGYVGLPLALEFGKYYDTYGFDLSESKIAAYTEHHDPTGEASTDQFAQATRLRFGTDPAPLALADVIIVAVPTPVDAAHQPDFTALVNASTLIAQYLKKGAIVVYESTVYPGATEEICVPILEKQAKLKWRYDFHVGYSPERVNPGDKARSITKIVKVVSGDDEQTTDMLCDLYGTIIQAGIHRATSIKVAEAAKVIENTQRDLNIALVNELAIIFHRLGIDTKEVLSAAETKWNFLPFQPGLVGGHCIGVDPYYLTHKAEMLAYHPEVILAGRRINDNMATYLAQEIVKEMIHAGQIVKGSRVIVLGLTFKENCSDLRNSKVAELIQALKAFGCDVLVHDPIADPGEAQQEYGLSLTVWEGLPQEADVLIAAVSHREYLDRTFPELCALLKAGGIFVDIKSAYNRSMIEEAGYRVWRL